MHESLIGEVEIMRRLIWLSASVRNIFAATPGCERMPAPMIEILPRLASSSTSIGPSESSACVIARRAAAMSSCGTENESSATPCTTFWMIVSTLTFSAATASNTSAAAPGRSGMPVRVKITSVSEWVTPEMMGFSTTSSAGRIQVPSSSENVEREWTRTP